MNVVICGGGTAGHVTPGIAIAETILEHEPTSRLLFIGRDGGAENELTQKSGYELKTLKIGGFLRKLTVRNVKNAFDAVASLQKAKKILREFNPDAVIGTGGYVCWPVIRAAQNLGVPTLIHESNATPGLTARSLAKRCTSVLLNYDESKKYFKNQDNLVTVGNPLRRDLISLTRENARKALGIERNEIFILSFGGSGGSDVLNQRLINLMLEHTSRQSAVKHVHATGKKYFHSAMAAHPALIVGHNGCKIVAFIDDIPKYLKAADIIISRAGAMTLSEIAESGAASILIPSPNVTDNHQYKNARLFRDAGAAILLEESELTDSTLLGAVRSLESDSKKRAYMRAKLKAFNKRNSREKILEQIRKAIEKT